MRYAAEGVAHEATQKSNPLTYPSPKLAIILPPDNTGKASLIKPEILARPYLGPEFWVRISNSVELKFLYGAQNPQA